MTIKLTFLLQREVMRFTIRDKEIWYSDRIWKGGVRCIPKDDEFIRKIITSRNKYPSVLIEIFNISDSDKKEYEMASTKGEEVLAEAVIKDCQEKGLRLIDRRKE